MNYASAKYSGVDTANMEAATKAAQVAAIRQRCSDWWEGCCAGSTYRKTADTGFISLVEHKFKVQIREQWYSDPKVDSLASWLWERGVRG